MVLMNIKNLHENLKFAGIVAKNPSSAFEISQILKEFNVETLFESKSAKALGLKPYSICEISKFTNFIISVGGDGTLIGTCREAASKCDNKPYILGVYDGSLGFLTDIKISEFKGFMVKFLRGEYEVEHPLMLEAKFYKNAELVSTKIAFNDVVFTRTAVLSMSSVDAYLNGRKFNSYYGDGVIISSPIGSTAYNMSAGGPIIYPLSSDICITPICSHSLTQRPLVISGFENLSFKNSSGSKVGVVIDGQKVYDMDKFDEIFVGLGKSGANLIRHIGRDYFAVLRDKLNWGHIK